MEKLGRLEPDAVVDAELFNGVLDVLDALGEMVEDLSRAVFGPFEPPPCSRPR